MSFTFEVDKVKPFDNQISININDWEAKYRAQYFKEGFRPLGIKDESIEAHSSSLNNCKLINPQTNSFVETALQAYTDHKSIVFSPDEIWLVILQAFTAHISRDPEACRNAIVPFEGKVELEVDEPHFAKGYPGNDWEGSFAKFSDKIAEHLGKKRDLFDPAFTTTTPTTKAAIQVQMMAALAPYFNYSMRTCCGVPHITLLGEVSDWEGIYNRVEASAEFYPQWAHQPLIRASKEFLAAAQGNPNLEFWQNFFKRSYGSGGTQVNGWINAFFPYTNNGQNHMMASKFEDVLKKDPRAGNDLGDYPGSVSSVPMLWNYHGAKIKMRLATGIFGRTTDDMGAHRSVIGWVVGEDSGERINSNGYY